MGVMGGTHDANVRYNAILRDFIFIWGDIISRDLLYLLGTT